MAGDRTNAGVARDRAAEAARLSRRISTTANEVDALSSAIDALSAAPVAFVNVSLGRPQAYNGTFTFTIVSSPVGSIVEIWESPITTPSGNLIGELGDRMECDVISASGTVTAATTATVRWSSRPGPLSEQRPFAYRIIEV